MSFEDIRNALSFKNKVVVNLGAKRLGEMAQAFQHHGVDGKFLREKNGVVYAKLLSWTEIKARLGDQTSLDAIRQQNRDALDTLAKRIDAQYGDGTSDRIGLTTNPHTPTTLQFADLDYHAAAAAAMHHMGVRDADGAKDRDLFIQTLKAMMRDRAASDGTLAHDLPALASQCVGVLFARDQRLTEKISRQLNVSQANTPSGSAGLTFNTRDDEQAALRLIKADVRRALLDPARAATSEDELVEECTRQYRMDLAAARDALKALSPPGEHTTSIVTPHELHIATELRRDPSLSPADRDTLLRREAMHGTLARDLPDAHGDDLRAVSQEWALGTMDLPADHTTVAWCKMAFAEHQRLTIEGVRQARLSARLDDPKLDAATRRRWMDVELNEAVQRANRPAEAFSPTGYLGKTMAHMARQTPALSACADGALPAALDAVVVSVCSKLPAFSDAEKTQTIAAFSLLMKDPSLLHALQDPALARFREDLNAGIAATHQLGPPEDKDFRDAWYETILGRPVLAQIMADFARTHAAQHAATAAQEIRQLFLQVLKEPTPQERAKLNATPAGRTLLTAWGQFTDDWRKLLDAVAKTA